VNVTDDLTSSPGNSGTASDTLRVNPQPGFDKTFAPNPIAAGLVSTLTFSIDNSGSTAAATGLDFADNLPAGMVVATPPNASTTCTGGTITAVGDTSVIAYTGGSVAAGATCTVQVDVTSSTAGDHANISGNLTSSLGDSGTARDTLTVEPVDFGDAPDPNYPTLYASNGASHILGSTIYLGSCVDAELDGQPTAGADGDDVNASGLVFGTCQEGDDEDGVTFLDLLIGDETADIEVTANAACTLSGWIDFNADGDWADADEDLFPGGTLLAPGVNTLSFTVPITAKVGASQARFRCTTDGATPPTGMASDGEVEDYKVEIWGLAYLPLVTNNYVVAPDLVVDNIIATSDAITVVVENVGNAPVTDEFWVDLYIDPNPAPTTVNQIWVDLADEGATWGVTTAVLPLTPGDVLTLTIGDAFYASEYSHIDWPLAAGTQVYAQVDSWDGSTVYGAVEEAHEIIGGAYNNILGPVLVAADSSDPPSAIAPMLGNLPRTSDSPRLNGRRYQWN
jgi:hypothetical protein